MLTFFLMVHCSDRVTCKWTNSSTRARAVPLLVHDGRTEHDDHADQLGNRADADRDADTDHNDARCGCTVDVELRVIRRRS